MLIALRLDEKNRLEEIIAKEEESAADKSIARARLAELERDDVADWAEIGRLKARNKQVAPLLKQMPSKMAALRNFALPKREAPPLRGHSVARMFDYAPKKQKANVRVSGQCSHSLLRRTAWHPKCF